MSRSGFTLIELLVVILIIGILAAFGVPQYLKSVENTKANSGSSLVTMVGTTNRMYALDHGLAQGAYPQGKLATSCGTEATCQQGGVTDPCSLVNCKYLAAQDFDSNPYTVYADNGSGGTCSGLGFGAGTWVACAVRQECATGGTAGVCASASPYTGWGYAVDTTGKITGIGTNVPAAVQ